MKRLLLLPSQYVVEPGERAVGGIHYADRAVPSQYCKPSKDEIIATIGYTKRIIITFASTNDGAGVCGEPTSRVSVPIMDVVVF